MNRDTRISGSVADAPLMERQSLYEQERHIAREGGYEAPADRDRYGPIEPGAEDRLRRALEQPAAKTAKTTEAAAAPGAAAGSLSSWGPGFSRAVLPEAVVPHELAQRLGERIGEMVDRLMVDTEGGGRQVRINLKDGALPGVSLVIQEQEGRLQVDFICREEGVRVRLNRESEGHAALLAGRLGREVLMRVMADDDEFPCIHEVVARP